MNPPRQNLEERTTYISSVSPQSYFPPLANPAMPQIPAPPIHLPFYLYPPPPPPPSDYPRIPTKHATLPTELQNISRADMEGKLSKGPAHPNTDNKKPLIHDKCSDHMRSSTLLKFGCSAETAMKDSTLQTPTDPIHPNKAMNRTEKRIVWAKQPTATGPSFPSHSDPAPGAWYDTCIL